MKSIEYLLGLATTREGQGAAHSHKKSWMNGDRSADRYNETRNGFSLSPINLKTQKQI